MKLISCSKDSTTNAQTMNPIYLANQEKAFCLEKCSALSLFKYVHCSSDLKSFANSRSSASTSKSYFQSIEQFFLTVDQNNFRKKIPLLNLPLEIHILKGI